MTQPQVQLFANCWALSMRQNVCILKMELIQDLPKKKLCCYGEEKSYCETAEGLACHCDAPTGANEQSKYPQNSVRKPVPIHAIKALALPGTTYYQHPHFTGVRNVSQDKKSDSGSKAEIQASFLPTAQSLCLPSSAWVVSFAQPTPTLTPSAVCCTQTPCKKTK